jgi:hypothetical protein
MIPTSVDFLRRFPHLAGVPVPQITGAITRSANQIDPNLDSYWDLVLLLAAHSITMDGRAMADEIGIAVNAASQYQTSRVTPPDSSSLHLSKYGIEYQRILESEVVSFLYIA